VNTDGSERTKIAGTEVIDGFMHVIDFRWGPGNHIAYYSADNGKVKLYVVSVNDAETIQISPSL